MAFFCWFLKLKKGRTSPFAASSSFTRLTKHLRNAVQVNSPGEGEQEVDEK